MNINQITAEQLVNRLWKLTDLTDLEKEVVKRRYGMVKRFARKPQTHEEIANAMKLDVLLVGALHDSAILKFREVAMAEKMVWKGKSL